MEPRLGGLFVVLAVLSLAFRGLERRWPQGEGRGTDLAYWFFTPFITKAVTRGAVIPVVLLWALARGVEWTPESVQAALASGWMGQKPLWLQLPAALFVADLSGYWIHRLFHGRALWRFHAVHHSSRTLDWLASVRMHPVNDFVTRALQLVPILALGFNPAVLEGLVPFLGFYGLLLHADVTWDFGPLRGVFVSPVFHRWHHTSQAEGLDKNFAGVFPVIDRLFGTYYLPEGRVPERFGILGEPVPDGLWAQLKYPFRLPAKPV